MSRFGPYINIALCTAIGVIAGQAGVRFAYKALLVLAGSWMARDDGLGMAASLTVWFIVRGVVAAVVSILSAYLLAHRWPALGKWPIPAGIGGIMSFIVSMKWAAYELSINRFWP